jgi:hypothetical protein
MQPSSQPSGVPTGQPSTQPTMQPSGQPSSQPTMQPSSQPSTQPSGQPSSQPTMQPSAQPSGVPTGQPSVQPSSQPSGQPTFNPTMQPTSQPTMQPSSQPSSQPSGQPSSQPSAQPTCLPTSHPSYVHEQYQDIYDIKRIRSRYLCENQCNGHGKCGVLPDRCLCDTDLNGEPLYTGVDCSLKACPRGFAWSAEVMVRNNDAHPWVECSNRGECNRDTGECHCYPPFEGLACQRTRCFNDCNGRGFCLPEKLLAERAGRNYSAPWDAMKIWGCLCDAGYRGPDCSLQECPSREDPLGGFGNEAGRDCSGRGHCDYKSGLCNCFRGFHGAACNKVTELF